MSTNTIHWDTNHFVVREVVRTNTIKLYPEGPNHPLAGNGMRYVQADPNGKLSAVTSVPPAAPKVSVAELSVFAVFFIMVFAMGVLCGISAIQKRH